MLHGYVKPLVSEVVSRPLLSVDFTEVAVRPCGKNTTAASETLGWLLFRSRGAGGLLCKLVVYLEGLWLTGIARYWNAEPHSCTMPSRIAHSTPGQG